VGKKLGLIHYDPTLGERLLELPGGFFQGFGTTRIFFPRGFSDSFPSKLLSPERELLPAQFRATRMRSGNNWLHARGSAFTESGDSRELESEAMKRDQPQDHLGASG